MYVNHLPYLYDLVFA